MRRATRRNGSQSHLEGETLKNEIARAVSDRVRYMAHYEARKRNAFVCHLNGCCAHYRAARHAGIWARDIAVMDRLARELAVDEGVFGFRLEGRDLVAMPQAPLAVTESTRSHIV